MQTNKFQQCVMSITPIRLCKQCQGNWIGTHESLLSWKCCSKNRRRFSTPVFSSPVVKEYCHLGDTLTRHYIYLKQRTFHNTPVEPKIFCRLRSWRVINRLMVRTWAWRFNLITKLTTQLVLLGHKITCRTITFTPCLIILAQFEKSRSRKLCECRLTPTTKESKYWTPLLAEGELLNMLQMIPAHQFWWLLQQH